MVDALVTWTQLQLKEGKSEREIRNFLCKKHSSDDIDKVFLQIELEQALRIPKPKLTFLQRTKKLLFSPHHLYSHAKHESTFVTAGYFFGAAVFAGVILALSVCLARFILLSFSYPLPQAWAQLNLLPLLGMTALSVLKLLGIGCLVVCCGMLLCHPLLKAFGAKGNIRQSFHLFAYSYVPLFLSLPLIWIPKIGVFRNAAVLLQFILVLTGCEHLHDMTKKEICMLMLPILISVGLVVFTGL